MKRLKRWSTRELVAVDYDRHELRLAVAKIRGESARVLTVQRLAFPVNADTNDPAIVGQLLATAAKQMGLSGCDAILTVPRSQVVLKPLSLPPNLQEHEIASMVHFQVAKELPFGAEEAIIDFTMGGHWDAQSADPRHDAASPPLPAGPGTLLTTAAIRLPVLDAARSICEQAGLKLAHLALRPHACLAAVQRCTKTSPGQGVLFVYVSADDAEISLFRDGQVEFSRSVPLGSGPDREDRGQDARGTHGRDGAPKREIPRLGTPAHATNKRVALDALRCLQSLQATAGGSSSPMSIDTCLLASGSTQNSPGGDEELLAELKRLLEIPCQSFDPAAGLSLPADDYSGFTLALGLAAGGPEKLAFDFANPKRPMAAPDVKRQRALIAVAAACAVLLGVVLFRVSVLGRREAQVNAIRAQIAELKETNGKLKRLSSRVQAIESWQTAEPEWLDQLANLSVVMPPAQEVYVGNFKTSRDSKGNAPMITLELRAKDDNSLTRFTHDLKGISGYEPEPRGTNPASDRYGYSMRSSLEVDVSGKARELIAASQPVGRPADDSHVRAAPAETGAASAVAPSAPTSAPSSAPATASSSASATGPSAAPAPAGSASAAAPAPDARGPDARDATDRSATSRPRGRRARP